MMFDDPNVSPQFSEPPPLAREHWPKLAKALRKLDELRAHQNRCDVEQQQLRDQLADARSRDREALGDALAQGAAEPESEADVIEAEIARLGRNSAALTGKIVDETRRVSEWVEGSGRGCGRIMLAGRPTRLLGIEPRSSRW
jgi:hypothetical protein